MKKLYEILYNIYHKRAYFHTYFFKQRKYIARELRSHKLYGIKGHEIEQWKPEYRCLYFKAKKTIHGQPRDVFIKVMGNSIRDCFCNEVSINKYIENHSEYINDKNNPIVDSFAFGDYFCIVSEFLVFDKLSSVDEHEEDIMKILSEYTKCGIIHTDFSLCNMGLRDGEVIFFDYGTSLFIGSDNIRVRNGSTYNHINDITKIAKSIIANPDFYYDDAIHCGIKNMDREILNFIVGSGNTYFVKLADKLVTYTLKKKRNSIVYLLQKNSVQIFK